MIVQSEIMMTMIPRVFLCFFWLFENGAQLPIEIELQIGGGKESLFVVHLVSPTRA